MSDREAFLQELVRAGRRQCSRGDEESAPEEDKVLHVAMSYRHVDRFDRQGTIDRATAEAMYNTVLAMPLVGKQTVVRIWIDQNLHRYQHSGPWYQRGFLPYVLMKVATVLMDSSGFAIGRRRPWIWVETALATAGGGIHCAEHTMQTIQEIMVYPEGSLLHKRVTDARGYIPVAGSGVVDSISECLRTVSLWSPDVLEHHQYEYIDDFIDFSQWAKAQTVRLRMKGKLDLSSDTFERTILEDVSWIRSLTCTAIQRNREIQKSPYVRIEQDNRKSKKLVSLMKASAKCQVFGSVTEMIGDTALDTFCFIEGPTTTLFNVNPPEREARERALDSEPRTPINEDLQKVRSWLGGYTVWDRRFRGKRPPKFRRCGRIFNRHCGMRPKLGMEGDVIDVGGFRFEAKSFMIYGTKVEYVYISRIGKEEVIIAESDVLCLRGLGKELEREFVLGLVLKNSGGSVARILKAEADVQGIDVTSRTLGTRASEILADVEDEANYALAGSDEVNIRRVQRGSRIFAISVYDDGWGHATYCFRTTADQSEMSSFLVGFRTGGDVHETLTKVRLMMGSDEFRSYSEEGLCLGIGARSGTVRYPMQFHLRGSEFNECTQCRQVYSPVNGRTAILSSRRETRMIHVEWGPTHDCGMIGMECQITGPVAGRGNSRVSKL